MFRKIFLLIVIFSICSCSYYRTKHITKQRGWEDYLPANIPGAIIKSSVKHNKAIKDGKIEPKRGIGEEWIDSNGKKWVQRNGYQLEISDQKVQKYTGWWVYGEEQHIFKDEESLGEWDLIFPNENMEELVELYLSITEMEYFPMECKMIGILKKEIVTKQTTLIVSDFEILYIQGCGE